MKIIECPRDALQGLNSFVPTSLKIEYLNLLLKVGFDTLDFGSFVSPKAVPQMADTAEVLAGLNLSETRTKLLAIVANARGAEQACSYSSITYLGFPLSVSETFQKRNTNASTAESLEIVKEMLALCKGSNKELVVYLSMAFGNPYGDSYSTDIVLNLAQELQKMGCSIISLADTVGLATPAEVKSLGHKIITSFPNLEIGMHLHTRRDSALDKLKAALEANCQRIDTALGGLGGCPFANDELVGNMPTEILFNYLSNDSSISFNQKYLQKANILLQESIMGR